MPRDLGPAVLLLLHRPGWTCPCLPAGRCRRSAAPAPLPAQRRPGLPRSAAPPRRRPGQPRLAAAAASGERRLSWWRCSDGLEEAEGGGG